MVPITTTSQILGNTLAPVTAISPAVANLAAQVATVKSVAVSNSNVIPSSFAPEIAILIGISKVIRPLFGNEGKEIIDAIDADLDILSGLPVA
jgi:hypothetical protein